MGNSDKSGAADGVTVDLDEPQGCYQGVGKGVDSRDAGGLQVDRSTAVAPLRVLFVDDETPIREVMRIELPRMGHEVTVCEDGEAAVAVLGEQHFDAAIVDLKMPGISGWEVTDHIKQVSPETFVICLLYTSPIPRD